MMIDFLTTTAIRFTDGTMEGQVLHVGTKESCDAVADMLLAINYCGPKTPTQSRILVINQPPETPPIKAGQWWIIDPSQE